ncbi:hypothetical protein ACFP1I_23930 [Dyadobacter subterraneus]|uniref:Restriction endonuclease type IV Mrr domain-containing protein n=1 Tax=Dyadobacter subterraneus TaxID=2773304 RepID=A0ABR9WMB6_9BACT|nr:hypothetical protein [Dyadobacter subterraneus]MBE9466503.1 hypothetical protein [Dyadobacter subterraneus]
MAEFDFSTLNSSDLEELVCDLLNAKSRANNSKVTFKTFKDGKDKGIDILHSVEKNNYAIIGQVKHYWRSNFNLLLRDLKKEKLKVDLLSPSKYVFATSLDLSPQNVLEIKMLLKPHIKSLSDIYGNKGS